MGSLPLSVARRFELVECEPVGQIPGRRQVLEAFAVAEGACAGDDEPSAPVPGLCYKWVFARSEDKGLRQCFCLPGVSCHNSRKPDVGNGGAACAGVDEVMAHLVPNTPLA